VNNFRLLHCIHCVGLLTVHDAALTTEMAKISS